MELANFIPQLGIGGIFAFVAYKLYNDMRQDSLRREEQIRSDSKDREQKLLEHLDKVADTLENINSRLTIVENNVCSRDRQGA